MRIRVDYGRCSGHGMCEGIAEDIFKVRQDGQVHLLCDDVSEDRRSDVQEAVDVCPTQALRINDQT